MAHIPFVLSINAITLGTLQVSVWPHSASRSCALAGQGHGHASTFCGGEQPAQRQQFSGRTLRVQHTKTWGSVVGVVTVVLGAYLILGYMDPWELKVSDRP